MSFVNKICLVALIVLALVGCGKVKVEGVPQSYGVTIKSDSGYTDIYDFCDRRYVKDSEANKQCIKNGIEYSAYKLKVSIEALNEFCKQAEDIDQCHQDMQGFIDSLSGN